MRFGFFISLLGMSCITLVGCQKSKSEEPTELVEDATAGVAQGPVSCRSLNIPTYDLVIKDLSALRCDNCHNEVFAWNGIVLTQYDMWKMFVKPIRNRIFYNFLTQPLEPAEQELFLTWIDRGLPRTDADCGS